MGNLGQQIRHGRGHRRRDGEDRYHPVRDYLTGLTWDGKLRIEQLFPTYMGAADSRLSREIGRCFLVSAVARVYDPGCKVDTSPVLVGKQGARKSTAVRTLAGSEWFSDTEMDLDSKDKFEQIRGVWLYELAELDAFKGREWPRIKRVLSSPEDNYRRPYGRNAERVKRQCVYVGTTNADEFLGDATGSRRFLPVAIGTIDIEKLARDRDQLWAEACTLYRAGSPWFLSAPDEVELQKASAAYQVSDPWERPIRAWIEKRATGFQIAQVLTEALEMRSSDQTKSDQMRAADIVRALGCTRITGVRPVVWRRGTR